LIPDIARYSENLERFCKICSCDEIVLFEKETFLIIASFEASAQKNISNYERVSNIIK
jgi:Ras-related GTP-binding protein A/B